MKKIKVGVVGVGRMGLYHVGVYSELTNVNLVGIADPNMGRITEIAQRYNTTPYEKYSDLFGKVNLVSIAVPTSLHYPVAKDFLENGIHVLLEKPIASNLQEAEELFALAEKKGLVLHIGHVERFNGAVQELKKIVSEPILIESRRLSPYDTRIQDDGVVMDMMIHDLDIVLNLVDAEIDRINVIGNSIYTQKDDVVNVQLHFTNNCIANITASRVSQTKIRTLAVTQKDAYVFLDYTDQDIHIHRKASSEHFLTRELLRYKQESFIERIFVHRDNPLKLEIKHFIDCAFHGGERMIPAAKDISSLKLAMEIGQKFRQSKNA